ncbi:hypothetical protein HSB1_18630 [Halogranum salarium B-1]|uniref:Uncharacterized protein n=2 Tax=Halogranum rubrum TaxID=553466 RepID=J2ZGA9_9EURY|nr:hypothetical protein HSB1_18630 [Halogranum salarium B-1]
MEDTWKERNWEDVDYFWDGFKTDHELLFVEQQIRELERTSNEDAWGAIDELWDSYAEHQQTELKELQELMETLGAVWSDEGSQFDSDPLTTNWRPESKYEGPLRTTVNEEDWSQWLAHLLRTSTGSFSQALLGTPNRSPDRVRREVVFSDGQFTRRIDILVEYEDTAVSMEVKNGDTNYGKTPQTAGLVERDDTRDWSHILLLQENKLQRLRQSFGETLDESTERRPTIQSEGYPDIDVRCWKDVSRLLRQMLLDDREPGSHWAASAYLFITLIEQRILELHSFAFVSSPSVTDSDTTATTDLHRLVAVEPAAQINYIRFLLQKDYTHE